MLRYMHAHLCCGFFFYNAAQCVMNTVQLAVKKKRWPRGQVGTSKNSLLRKLGIQSISTF